jgi:hypothetical protein
MHPLSTPVHPTGRKEERPPRRGPEAASDTAQSAPSSASEAPDDPGPTPPDHLDITV